MDSKRTDLVKSPIGIMLSRFMASNNHRTILIRGAWGVGKTHAVTEFLDQYNFQSDTALVARSDISLFGSQNISDIQRGIFSSAIQVGKDEDVRKVLGLAAHRMIQLEKHLKQSSFRRTIEWVRSKIGQVEVPWIGRLGGMLGQGNYGLVDRFLVVIDDLERKSDGVSLKDALGVVVDLSSKRSCKVIVVCNEDALGEEDREFLNDYKEKVFDLELLFTRSPLDIARIGLPEGCEHRAISENILEKLGVSNIRVVKRYAFLVDQVWPDIKSVNEEVMDEVLKHIAILTWAKYDSTAGIPQDRLSYLSSEVSWMASSFGEKGEGKEQWEVNWETAAASLEFSSEPYDKVLVEYLRTGIWLPGSITKDIEAKSSDLRKLEASQDLRRAWRLYADSLDPDQTGFVVSLTGAIAKNLELLSPREVDSAFVALEDLGVDFDYLAKDYITAARSGIESAALEDWPFEDFKSTALRPLVAEVRSSAKVLPTIDAALHRIAVDRSWSEEEIKALEACTEEDLFEWMQSGPDDLSTKIRKGILFLGSQKSDARYASIGEKGVLALKRVARLSDINRLRVEHMYNVVVD